MGEGERTSPAMEATMLVGERSLTALEQAAPDPLIGRRLKHFEVQKPLGRGGMGAVYLGRDTSLDRQVAIKVLDATLAHDPEVLARFVREARAQARLRHPNVAQIYFIGEDAGTHFFVMEYLEGPALDALLASGRPLPWAEALEYTLYAARGLRAAVAEGFVHRDVKPSNLMRDRESGIKILDFGLVKSMKGDAELTRDGAIVGSPLYMAPEQGRGEDVDHRTDIYSLGCALYHMLTGRPPFQAPSPVGIIAMHVTDKAAPMRTLVPELPDAAETIVARMMAKRPSDRFRDYDHLIAALEAARPDVSMRAGLRERALALAIDLVPIAAATVLVGPWALLVAAVYFVVNHRLSGRTIGKMLMRLRVTDFDGKPIDWKPALVRFAVFAWGILAWGILAGVIYLVHRHDRVAFTIAHLTWRQLALPLVYGGLAAAVFMAYLGGFLLVAFHPQRRALHDVLARTEVRRARR